jgi:DNA-binding NtrC family response regulator
MATFLRRSSRDMSHREPREENQRPGMLTPFRQGTVLVLTPSEQLAGVVAHALEGLGSSGPRLSTVQTLADCLVALRLLAPSLVILDDAVTGQTGAEALDALERIRSGTPIIYFATHHTLDLEREVRRRGVLYYVQMPETREQLDMILCRLLTAFVREARVRGTP